MGNWIKSLFSKRNDTLAASVAVPADGRAYLEQADTCFQSGDFAAAADSYRQALTFDPDLEAAYAQLCLALCQQGAWEEAESAISEGIARFPQSAEFHFLLGNIEHMMGKQDQALVHFRKAIAIEPNHVPAYINLSASLQGGQQWQEALSAIDAALRIDAGNADLHLRRGYLLQMQGEHEAALQAYRQALALQPALLQAHVNIGSLFEEMLRPEQAEAAYREALALNPGDADMLFNLGSSLDGQHKFDEAMSYYRQALAIDAGHVKSLVNLARLLDLQGYPDQALVCLEQVCASHPELTDVWLNKSSLLMRHGRFREAWEDYEYREKRLYMPVEPDPTRPLWDGQADLSGKTILLYGEQGFGDILQFLRYTKLVAATGATVYLYVPPQLKSLAASCAGVAVTLTDGEAMGHFDFMCPLMSLPYAFKTELDTIPAEVPYLRCDPARRAHWRKKIGPRTASIPASLRVGLTWAGNPRKSRSVVTRMDRTRSLRLEQILPLLDVPGVEFFSLQLGEGSNWNPQDHPNIVDFTAELTDFQETAALMENLDLVITVDTAVVHLAGALGLPVWLMDRYDHCFRWLHRREDSPWYPTLRIFRQAKLGEWDSVVEAVRHELGVQAEFAVLANRPSDTQGDAFSG